MSLNNNHRNFDWKSFLLGIFFALNFASMIMLSLFLIIFNGEFQSIQAENGSQVFQLLASGVFLLGLLFIPGMALNFIKAARVNFKKMLFPVSNKMLLPVIITAWLTCIAVGIWFDLYFPFLRGIIPILNIFAISFPILVFLRISFHDLVLPDQRKIWSMLGFGFLFPPFLAIILEFIVIGLLIIFYLLLASFSPGLLQVLESASESLRTGTAGSDEITTTIAKLIFAPGVTTIAFIAFSILIPIIEETSKIILIFPLLKKIKHPIEGFVFGALLGAAFSLVENIGFSGTSAADWGLNSLVRASAALPHIFNSGLMGFSIIDGYQKKSIKIILAALISVVVLHGTWNAISLGLALTDLSNYLTEIPFYLRTAYPWIAGWLVLTVGVLTGIIQNNRQLQKLQKFPTSQPDV